MSDPETNIHVLDSAYKPFPSFKEWVTRTSVDSVRWERYKAELGNKALIPTDALRRAYEIVKRAAALDTGAIEGLYEVDRGFTFTVAMETAAWELKLAEKGENVRPLFEAQLHAYDFVLDFATKAEPISEAAIRKLHEVVCGAQATYRVQTAVGPQEQALPKGRYKVLPNHVRTRDGADHSYAPVDVTPAEMARLVSEMRSESFLVAHPVLQAAYAHYGLVVVHPFADGNGRVARALASVFTYRAISMPIMILSEHKGIYLDALEDADRGEFQSFVKFMLLRSLDTMTLVAESSLGTRVPTAEEGAAALSGLYVTRGGYSQERVDGVGREFFELVRNEITNVINRNSGPQLRGRADLVTIGPQENAISPSHRLLVGNEGDPKFLYIDLSSSPPAQARLSRSYFVWLPRDAASEDDIQLVLAAQGEKVLTSFGPSSVAFSARVDELIPVLSGVLQIRISLLAERIVGEMLSELRLEAQKALSGAETEWP